VLRAAIVNGSMGTGAAGVAGSAWRTASFGAAPAALVEDGAANVEAFAVAAAGVCIGTGRDSGGGGMWTKLERSIGESIGIPLVSLEDGRPLRPRKRRRAASLLAGLRWRNHESP
jgi:hypothetical protein